MVTAAGSEVALWSLAARRELLRVSVPSAGGVSAVALAAGAAVSGEGFPIAWSWRLLGLFGFQAVIVSFVSYLLWFWLIRHYPATKLSSFTLSTPLFGLLAGALLLAEPITPRLMLALAGLAAALAVAIGVVGMPIDATCAAAAHGAAFGLFPIGWIIVTAMFLYALSVEAGALEVMKRSVTRLSPDHRAQALLVAVGGPGLEAAGALHGAHDL